MAQPTVYVAEASDIASPFQGVSRVINPKGAALAQLYPFDPSSGSSASAALFGHYRAQGSTSAALFGASANLATFRFAPSASGAVPTVCVITGVYVSFYVVTAVTAQRMDPVLMFPARSYTVSESVNNTNATLTGNNGKLRTSFATTGVAQFATASAAAGISGGTKTVDASAIGQFAISLPGMATGTLGNGTVSGALYEPQLAKGEYPLTLLTSEGFVVQWGATALATGTAILSVEVHWAELGQF